MKAVSFDPSITTPRLVIRPANMTDLPQVQAAKEAMWPELQQWMSWAYDDQKPLAALEKTIGEATDPCTLLWGFCRETGDYVVSTGLSPQPDNPDIYETGYWVAKTYLRRGFATEATNAAIRYAFGAKAAKAVTIGYFEGNDKSRAIIEKLGFAPLDVRIAAHKRCSDGEVMDEYKYIRTEIDGLPDLDVIW